MGVIFIDDNPVRNVKSFVEVIWLIFKKKKKKVFLNIV